MPTVLFNPNSLWLRSATGAAELEAGQRKLGVRERSVLLLANGRKTTTDLLKVLPPNGFEIIERLVHLGHLHELPPARPEPTHARTTAATAQPATAVSPTAEAAAPPGNSADDFSGRRSLATTRMFLLDIVERMFSRRDAVLAARLRDQLRQATDRDAMLSVGRDVLIHIEEHAGAERADSIAERLAAIVPVAD